MLISCITVFLSSTHNCPVKTVNLLTECWKTQMPFCSEQQQCCFLLYACAVFSFSSNVKLLFFQHRVFITIPKSFPFYRFPKGLPLSSLHGKEVSIPGFPCCCPHFHSLLNLLLGDAKRELSCAHLSRGPEGLCVCTPLDVMCVKLLFSEY